MLLSVAVNYPCWPWCGRHYGAGASALLTRLPPAYPEIHYCQPSWSSPARPRGSPLAGSVPHIHPGPMRSGDGFVLAAPLASRCLDRRHNGHCFYKSVIRGPAQFLPLQDGVAYGFTLYHSPQLLVRQNAAGRLHLRFAGAGRHTSDQASARSTA